MTRLRDWARQAAASTPGRFRLWSLVVAGGLVVLGVAGGVAASALVDSTDRIRRNAGPVLVATQSVTASLAEADAAATAAFLSGREEDPEQRRLYEQALARAVQQTEEVSSLIGDDEDAHVDLQEMSVLVNRYAGLIEAARAGNRAGIAGSERYLLDALDLLAGGISDRAADLGAASEARLRADERNRTAGVLATVAVGALVLVLLVVAQVALARRTRRLLNLPLALATLLVLTTLGWMSVATARSEDRRRDGRRDGYQSITLTADIARAAYGARSDETVALIAADRTRQESATAAAAVLTLSPVTPELVDAVRAGEGAEGAGLFLEAARRADSAREKAAVAELLVRWQRYADTVTRLRSAPTPEAGRAIAVDAGSSTFNGFNFSLESVLGDNRTQFLEALDRSSDALRGLTLLASGLPLLAALAALVGFQLRINEYR
ncbi:MAG TPA: hypothetical protein VM933_08395 [Acidimicrobiales bacterium]|nr:hypothetical protein [Acidimicrobiales bacterium]